MTVNAQTGTQLYTQLLTAAAVNEFTVNPWQPLPTPDPTAVDQTSVEARTMRVRYVRVSAPIGEP